MRLLKGLSSLGSTALTTTASGVKTGDLLYKPWGETRYDNGTTPTSHRFTGQREDATIGLYFYNARYYDPALGRFTQPDTIVPQPGNPGSLNRYSYVLNNPLRYRDPSGHAPQNPGDPDDMPGECTTQWCWQNRWYRARGFSWHGSGWSAGGGIRFYDEGILSETVGEAGITFAGGWDWKTQEAQMTAIGQGIVMFGQKLSAGLSQLKNLLGGGASIAQGSCFGRPCALPPGTSTVRMPKSADATWNMQTIVHELAHIIDWHSKIQIGTTVSFGELPVYGHFSDAWAGEPLTMYAAGQDGAIFNHQWETWAEAVTVWVFGGSYKASERPLHVDVGSQMVRISELLNGWR